MKALIWVHERCTWVYVFHMLGRCSMNTTLSDGTIYVQWPSYGHVGVLKESIPMLNDLAEAMKALDGKKSRSPSPFCSMIVPSIGTSIVAFRLTCARLHFHVSGANRPLAASNSSDGNSGWSFIGSTSSLITNFSPCSGWGCCP